MGRLNDGRSRPRPHARNKPEDVWKRVIVGDADECWTWNGSHNRSGYGQFHCLELTGKTDPIGAYRVTWALAKNDGKLNQAGSQLHHRCKNPGCVNPDHLELAVDRFAHWALERTAGCRYHGHENFFRGRCQTCRSQRIAKKREREEILSEIVLEARTVVTRPSRGFSWLDDALARLDELEAVA